MMGKLKALFQRPPEDYMPVTVGDVTFTPAGHYGSPPEPTLANRLSWAWRNLRILIATSGKR